MPIHPRLIFGGSTIGAEWGSLDSVKDLLERLQTVGIDEIDAAGLYPATDSGACERLLGEAGAASLGFRIDTKVLTGFNPVGTLEAEKINASVSASIDSLKFQPGQKFHIVHFHAHDPETPIKDQIAAIDALYKEGKFEKFGVCNYPLETLKELIKICDEEGYVKPTVYQGMYNVVARGHEGLFPYLRENDIVFNAHSPVASGFLSGKLTAGNIEGTRFNQDNIVGDSLRNKYDKKELHDAIRSLNEILEPAGISIVEATLRWLGYHSKLRPQDGIILGATKPHYIAENVKSIDQGPLPPDVVAAMDKVWETLSAGDIAHA